MIKSRLWRTLQYQTNKNLSIMKPVIPTKENNAKIRALKKVKQTQWNGNTRHESLDACLTAMNLESGNSGRYKPDAVRIPGLIGIYMLNEDGSIYCDARVIKEDEKKFAIEYLLTSGYNEFESHYLNFISEE